MEEKVKKDILDILEKSLELIRENNILALKQLSNHTIHDASIFQDEHSISTAVIIYSIAKIFERPRYKKYKTWSLFYKTTVLNLKKAQISLEQENIQDYEQSIHIILKTINKLEPKLSKYIKEVFEKARISKGSRLHEHGISAARTSALLGISEWELMDYIGKTGISDVSYSITKTIKQRIKLARSLFK